MDDLADRSSHLETGSAARSEARERPRFDARPDAAALAASAVALGVFPLLRPFFPLDVFSTSILEAAAGPVASPAWLLSHLMAMLAFVALPFGILALGDRVAAAGEGAAARRAAWWSLGGVGLVLPAFGVESFALPLIGRAYLDGRADVEALVAPIYRGPMTLVLLVGLAMLAVGAFGLAGAIRRTGVLPGWAAIVFALGLALWCPIFPRAVRVLDGLLIGIGGAALALGLWRGLRSPRASAPGATARASGDRSGTPAEPSAAWIREILS
jgi:hypothetical protein